MEFGERVNTRVMATSGDDQGEPQRPDLLQQVYICFDIYLILIQFMFILFQGTQMFMVLVLINYNSNPF